MRISDWSSDVCSSDLLEILVERMRREFGVEATVGKPQVAFRETIRKICESSEGKFIKQSGGRGQYGHEIGRASCRARVCQYVSIQVVAVSLKQIESKMLQYGIRQNV